MGALAFGIVCAIATGVALFGWFRGALFGWFHLPQAGETKPAPEKFVPDYAHITDSNHLRESARLAELQIKEAREATEALEKKAVLLITLCIAVLTYLGAKEFGEKDAAYAPHDIIRVAAFVFAAVSAAIAARVVDLGWQGVAGLSPKRIAYYAQYYSDKKPMDLALRYTLEKYQDIIDKAEDMHTKKVAMFLKAKNCLLCGIAGSLGWMGAELFVLFEPHLAETIAKFLARIGQ